MHPLVIIILTFGAVLGYGFARLQLKGRFILAQEAIEDAEAEIAAARYRELRREVQPQPTSPHRNPDLIITPRCPTGYSAAQILGYNDFGIIHPSQYPGGKAAWFEEN